jgi:hypothetical protein
MGFKIPGSQRNCATCAHWTGTRKLAGGSSGVEVESPSARGPCAERTRGNIPVSANQACSKFVKWQVLKG